MKGFCKHCGRVLFKTPSGAVCWTCSDRIIPHVSDQDIEWAKMASYTSHLPKAFQVSPRRYTVDEMGDQLLEIGIWNPDGKSYEAKRSVPVGARLNTVLTGAVIANVNGRARLLIRCLTPDERKAKKRQIQQKAQQLTEMASGKT